MATYQARWGNKGFIVEPTKVVPLTKLATSLARKSTTGNDTSGTPTTNTTGMELQKISLETVYVAGAGVDPRAQMDDWRAQFGERYPLILNGKQFGPNLLELESVDFSDILLDNLGRILSMKCIVVLVEYVPAEDKVSTTASTGDSGESSGYTKERRRALESTPKPSEKNKKKPINDFEREIETRYPSNKGGGGLNEDVQNEKL